ncbi:ExbD/TolR family protein [Sedimentitalea todarodis]|uniref:Biopolymer transporter ExbD n=1 Tax=Sedimentitalea todarodis TaxID=1631240 RepID=A0ABU3VIE2_9RHOB|nr:biopolymer transporter ExbD [Sedimentitalea todarodis]MDU9005943.1 biopolymer transporter ExbD [Sedimentitalea todarodis]
MANELALRRARRTGPLISLVPMIDVMLILLVFFMVTSTYLNLDMIPAVKQQDRAGRQQNPNGETVLIRLAADGAPVLNGKPLAPEAFATLLRERVKANPLTQVLLLPSGAATTQSLISVMDIATRAGVERLQVIRLEARP